MAVKLNFEFRKELARIIDGNLVSFCYQCGACVGDCPSRRYDPAFNPRELMLKVLYGMESELISESSPVWHCTNCYTCYERCPQRVKPVEIIIALKNLMAERGIYPPGVADLIATVRATGRSVKVTSLTERLRSELGLPPLAPVDVSEFEKILAPEEAAKKEGEDK